MSWARVIDVCKCGADVFIQTHPHGEWVFDLESMTVDLTTGDITLHLHECEFVKKPEAP